jgi:hypothetical protein
MTSSFQERVKAGNVTSLDMHKLYRPYQKNFSKLDRIFGRPNVLLWKYDPATFLQGDVVQDFSARLGISPPNGGVARRNASLPRRAVCLLYTYRKIGRALGWNPLRSGQAMQLALRVVPRGDSLRFSPNIMRDVLEANREDIEWMEQRLGEPLREDLGEPRPGDIFEERDLLRPDPETVSALLAILGRKAPPGISGETPEQLALLFHALRGEPVGEVEIRNASSWSPEPQAEPVRATGRAVV